MHSNPENCVDFALGPVIKLSFLLKSKSMPGREMTKSATRLSAQSYEIGAEEVTFAPAGKAPPAGVVVVAGEGGGTIGRPSPGALPIVNVDGAFLLLRCFSYCATSMPFNDATGCSGATFSSANGSVPPNVDVDI